NYFVGSPGRICYAFSGGLACRLVDCLVVGMDRIEKSNEDVHVQQRDHGPYSWSRSRFTNSVLTGRSPGRFGSKGTQLRTAGVVAEGPRDWRASSERTLPVEVLCK